MSKYAICKSFIVEIVVVVVVFVVLVVLIWQFVRDLDHVKDGSEFGF